MSSLSLILRSDLNGDSFIASDPSAQSRRRKPGQEAAKFKTDKSGKMIIEDESSPEPESAPSARQMEGNAYMASQTSAHAASRNTRGDLKFARNTKRTREAERQEDAMDLDEVMGTDKPKKKKQQVVKLGDEFRAKVSMSTHNTDRNSGGGADLTARGRRHQAPGRAGSV